jgi:hypothetical protein
MIDVGPQQLYPLRTFASDLRPVRAGEAEREGGVRVERHQFPCRVIIGTPLA